MSGPNPSIEEMLCIGFGCGLTFVSEAHSNYMRHYDLFFSIEDYNRQVLKYVEQLKASSLTRVEETSLVIVDETIAEAANRLNIPLRVY